MANKEKKSSLFSMGKKNTQQESSSNNKKSKIPRTVQDTLDWICVFGNGVFQIAPKRFSKSFQFDDISFKTQSDEEQNRIYESYIKFLNLMQAGEDLFITFHNEKEDEKQKLSRILPQHRGDQLDELRDEMAEILQDKMKLARNCISTSRYITIIVDADSVDEAMRRINALSGELTNNFKKVANTSLKEMSLARRLEVLGSILQGGDQKNYWFIHDQKGNTSVDFDRMAKHGYTTKDIIAPSGMKFEGNRFIIGERFGQAMYLDGLSNWIDSNILTDLIDVNFESVFTMHISVLAQEEATKKVHNQSVNITGELQTKQDNALQNGKNPAFISMDLQKAKEKIDELQDDISNRDQRLFFMSFCATHFADNDEALKEQSQTIKNLAAKHMCQMKVLTMQQERGLISSLPLGHDKLFTNRLLTSEALGVFLPFNEVNKFDDGGSYYGVNAINKTLIVHDRRKGANYNGLFFGTSGSGKSFAAKREMVSAILTTDADVYIIDPDGEYSPVVEAVNGVTIKITPGNSVYLNPFDLDLDNSFDTDLNPITMKIDFICGLLETMLGNGAQLSPTQVSIVQRCVNQIYRPYLEHLQEMPLDASGRKPTIDRTYCPTMQNLFDALLSQPQMEAQNLALVMEQYTTGAFDTFAHRTNVDVNNRIILYDIHNIGTNLKELGLKICMNDIWNRMVSNRSRGKWTYFYFDEAHLFLNSPSTAEFLKSIYKRARKFWGVPNGITQNVEDFLNSPAARAIINNTSFVYMLNQSYMDSGILKNMLHLSDGDLEYITNVEPGHGLIHIGNQSIPFEDNFPTNTKLYHLMSTKAGEVA